MSYDEHDAKAEWKGSVHAARTARHKAKSLKRAKSPKASSAHEKALRMTKDNSHLYGKYMQ